MKELFSLREIITRFTLGILSIIADNYLFIEELCWEVVARHKLGPIKATVIWVMLVCPPARLHYPFYQFQPAVVWILASSHPFSLFKGQLDHPSLVQLVCNRPRQVMGCSHRQLGS